MTDQTNYFGKRVRMLRHTAKLTLKQLGERSGVGFSTIAKIEKNQLSPTYETISRLAIGLNIDISEFFTKKPISMSRGRKSITRAGDGIIHETSTYSFRMLNTDLKQKQFIPLHATIKAKSIYEFKEMNSHAGEECIYVLKGTIQIYTDAYEPITMNVGDSCYFDSQMKHACIAIGGEDAEVMWICSAVVLQHNSIE